MPKWLARLLESLAYLCWLVANLAIWGAAASLDLFPNGIVAVLAVILLNFPAIVIHELGHAWMAKRRGATVHKIVALPFSYTPSTRRISVEDKVPRGGDIGGYVSMSFPRGEGTRADHIAISAAGPLANLISGAAVLGLLAVMQPSPDMSPPEPVVVAQSADTPAPRRTTMAGLPSQADVDRIMAQEASRQRWEFLADSSTGLLSLFGFISIVLGLANLIPFRGSDGAMILRDLRRR